jgi:hypothetical protein
VTVVLRIESRPGPGMQRMFVATLTEHVGS